MDESDLQTRSSPHESPMTNITTPDVASEDDDIWASDGNQDPSNVAASSGVKDDMLSDLPTIKRQHMTDGYREGLSIGKAKIMQNGFDAGYPIGVAIALRAGKVLGCIEGILAAKDLSDESRVIVRKILDQAKQELAITALLKDMNDQHIVSFEDIPSSIQKVLSKWEDKVVVSTPQKMVQFRGININIVSQFDAKRLPEHSTARAFDASGTVVACYVPVHAGAQIWLEYSIDGPHPPKAAYLFKMLINGQVVTSWDCTAKHEYQGKTVYLLQTVRSSINNQLSVLQKSMAFGKTDRRKSPDARSDCIEIRVHRIEHRRRIRELTLDIPSPKQLRGTLRLKSHGLIEPYRPARKYQYQLLDPQDEPYATFRFYCRTQEYLERHQIIDVDVDRSLSSTSLAMSSPPSTYFNASSSPEKELQMQTQTDVVIEQMETATESEDQGQGQPSTPTKHVIHELGAEYHSPSVDITINHTFSPRLASPIKIKSPRSQHNPHSPRSPLRSPRKNPISVSPLKLKDSIEDLPSTVPRSPQSPKRFTFTPPKQDIPPSPTQHSSPFLPDALRIRKSRSLTSDIQRLFLDASTPPREKNPLESPVTQLLPAPRFAHPSPNPTPPGTASPRPARLPYQRHKPTHLNLDLSLTGSFIPPLNDYNNTTGTANASASLLHNIAPTSTFNTSSNTTIDLPRKTSLPFDTTSNTTTTTIPHRPLSPFTQSGLLRRLSYTSSNLSLRNRKTSMPRPSTPAPFIPTVQDIDAAIQAVPSEKIEDQVRSESKKETDGISPSRTLRRMRSTGLLNGLFGKGGRRAVT